MAARRTSHRCRFDESLGDEVVEQLLDCSRGFRFLYVVLSNQRLDDVLLGRLLLEQGPDSGARVVEREIAFRVQVEQHRAVAERCGERVRNNAVTCHPATARMVSRMELSWADVCSSVKQGTDSTKSRSTLRWEYA